MLIHLRLTSEIFVHKALRWTLYHVLFKNSDELYVLALK